MPTTKLKTLLLKLSKYTIDLKYRKGSEMHTGNALSRLHNLTDTPDNKDVIPFNFLQHFTPNYMSCNSKMASFPVNYMSWFPSKL